MAKRLFTIVTGGLLSALTGFGCQTNNPSTASAYPAPTFAAPQMMPSAPRPSYAMLPPPMPQYLPRPTAHPVAAAATPTRLPHLLASALGSSSWIPPVAPRPWRWIIIHHSATTTGGAAKFDLEHKAKGWDELGYDFVIGNGTDTRMGQVEVGPRWIKQKIGAHAKTPDNRYNEYGIGICLVGNYDIDHPNPKQIEALDKLVAYLMVTYHIAPDHILGHGMTKATDCPGKFVSIPAIRAKSAVLAGLGNSGAKVAASGDGEMLADVPPKK
jgi:hypothetical protein